MPTILKTSVIGYNIGLQKDCKISLRYDQFCKNSFLKIPNLKQSKLFVSINCLKNRNMSNIILSIQSWPDDVACHTLKSYNVQKSIFIFASYIYK